LQGTGGMMHYRAVFDYTGSLENHVAFALVALNINPKWLCSTRQVKEALVTWYHGELIKV